MRYEYKVLPAPSKGRKAPGVKSPEDRFALGLQEVMNDLAEDRWEYVRSDLLPSEERKGLRSWKTVYRSVLVFRRVVEMGDLYMGDPREGQSYAERLTAQRDAPQDAPGGSGFTPVGPAFRHSDTEDTMPEPDDAGEDMTSDVDTDPMPDDHEEGRKDS